MVVLTIQILDIDNLKFLFSRGTNSDTLSDLPYIHYVLLPYLYIHYIYTHTIKYSICVYVI